MHGQTRCVVTLRCGPLEFDVLGSTKSQFGIRTARLAVCHAPTSSRGYMNISAYIRSLYSILVRSNIVVFLALWLVGSETLTRASHRHEESEGVATTPYITSTVYACAPPAHDSPSHARKYRLN